MGVARAFGVPGVHTLALFDALRDSTVTVLPGRTEMACAFSADGYARFTGQPSALILTTGPGTLMSLGGVLEAALSYVPVVVLSSQVALEHFGRRHGALHEAPDQLASVRPIVKWAKRAVSGEQLRALVREAVAAACEPPCGPTYLELPADLLSDTDTAAHEVADGAFTRDPSALKVNGDIREAARLLESARRPVIWAGGGAVRSGAFASLASLAERLDSPVATTYMGKGAIDERHPLAAGSACEEAALLALIEDADVVLALGTELGAETTRQWTFRPQGTLLQVDATPDRIGSVYRSLPVIGDADDVVRRIASLIGSRQDRNGVERASRTRDAVGESLRQGDPQALRLLQSIREAVPWDAPTAWDMTILGYWAASAYPVAAGRSWLYPLGSGTIGYAMSAALGASSYGCRTLAVTGDGGAMYSLSELAVLAQHGLPVTWLIVDDGGYGVLRHYQQLDGQTEFAVNLSRPDFAALAASVGVKAVRTDPQNLTSTLRASFGRPDASVVVLEATLAPPPGLV